MSAQEKQFYLYIDGQNVTVSEEVYREYRHYARKEEYFAHDLKRETFVYDPQEQTATFTPSREASAALQLAPTTFRRRKKALLEKLRNLLNENS